MASAATYARALPVLAAHLGCAATEEAVLEARNAVDPATLGDAERERRGIVPLPATQAEALDALEADAVLSDALGPVLARSYLTVRRSEWAAYSAGDAAFEQQGHFEKY